MNRPLIIILSLLATATLCACDGIGGSAPSAELDEHGTGGPPASGVLQMSAAERAAQGIRTTPVAERALTATISAPGEVRTNAYASAIVTPRIGAQIVERHARLGDAVDPGQRLVTLSSVAMAEAQGALIEAEREWQRVRALGSDIVSEARYVAAQVARQRTYATVTAYGMSGLEIEQLLAAGDATRATGEFALLSPRGGTVIRDDFVVGELIEPGREIFEIADESVLWVQAEVSSTDASRLTAGGGARVSRDGTRWIDGAVVQVQHRLDETTRTQGVRIEVDNRDEALHPGDYVDVVLETAGTTPQRAVPNDAVVLMDGLPTVFEVEGDTVVARTVEAGASVSGWTAIVAGLATDDEVVTQGAFLIKSLLLKSRMGEGHAH